MSSHASEIRNSKTRELVEFGERYLNTLLKWPGLTSTEVGEELKKMSWGDLSLYVNNVPETLDCKFMYSI